jgi:hypothetical protein
LIEPASILTEILFAILGLIAVTAFFAPRSREERHALLLVAIAAYSLKAVLVPAYYWLLVATGHEGFAYFDSVGYHEHAAEMAFEFVNGLPHDSTGWRAKDPGYNVICAFLYVAFGSSTLIARLFNSVVATFTLLYVYRIACFAFDASVARVAVRLVAFLPFTLFMTINHRKEPVVIFVATLLFHHAYRIVTQQRGWANSVPILAFWLVPIYFLRSGFVQPFLALLLVMLFLTQRSFVIGVTLSAIVVVTFIAAQFLLPQVAVLDVQRSIESVDVRVEGAAHSVRYTGGLLRYAKVTSILDFWKIPLATFLLILMPFPPSLGRAPIYGSVLDVSHLVFLALLPQFFLGMREIFRPDSWKRRLPLFLYSVGILAVIGALSVGVLRYRETVIPIVAVITAAGLRVRQNFVWSGAVYVGLLVLAAFIYLNRWVL